MAFDATAPRKSCHLNRGVSIVEFVGCLAALGGGLVLGSMYLGVDVKAAAVGVLEKADISIPAILSDGATEGEESSAENTVPAESTAPDGETLQDETITAADENHTPQYEANTPSESADTIDVPPSLTEAEQLAATKACWLALSEAMKAESTDRTKSVRDPGNWQLFDYLLHRKRGHDQVITAIEAIDLNGVDQRLRAHVSQVLAWHRAGATLFDRATLLLTDAPAGKLSGPFAQSWQSAATQHRMEEQLILNKHKAVAGYLEHSQKAGVVTD